jgi:hypothetical protein
MATQRLSLTRDQLASFLQDFEQIKQFEKLFSTVDTINTVTLDEISVSAGNAMASATEALATIEVMKSILEYLELAPAAATQEQIAVLQDKITDLEQLPSLGSVISSGLGAFTAGSVIFAGASGALTQNNADFFWDNTNNFLGIGTSTPGYKLDVSATGTISGQFKTSGSINALFLADTNTTAETLYIGTVGNDFRVVTGSDERLRVTNAGNVGIGTTAPSYKLDVSATGNISGQFKTSGSINALYLADAGTTAGTLYVGTVGNDFRVVTGSNERLRIDNGGNVGIGAVANASALLDVQSTTKGVRMPNMTTTQKNAITSPAAGLMVFDTTLAKLCVYSGSAWQTVTSI